ncbi:methyl-transferase [Legionella adelaidensis]|uniref:Methyl-transferase n=1 Tax=Legionella adelaidensis TaxID=45056 RepID=A0A0W0R4E7_9GAMM|nr:hypothetical protein [Legionella adelaidensis]KTC65886.1 methyl-transferase [Legionella adelaidensis]
MVLDEQAIKYRSLDEWFTTPQGARVALAFAEEVLPLQELLKGENLLQLGNCGNNVWLSTLNFRNPWIVSPYMDLKNTHCSASLLALPFDRDSIDCLFAPLTIEAFGREKNPLDEMDRVVKPMGFVVILGVHPWSFWGFALKWGRLNCFANSRTQLTSSYWIKRAFLERGYRQCFYSSFYYIPPVKSKSHIHKLEFINEMGKMIWPFPAGFYCLVLQKYQPHAPDLALEEIKAEKDLLLDPTISTYYVGPDRSNK